jgi:cytochrome c oxidase assembly protein subunit 15
LIQAKLGAVTVLDANSPWSVAVHLSNALLLTALIILFAVRLSGKAPIPAPPVFAWSAAIATLLAVATMASAAMTSKMGAALACYEWPSCDGTAFLPDVADDPGLAMHLAHRGLAAATGLALLLLAALAWKSGNRRLKVLCTLAVAIICMQVSLGAGVILLEVPIPVAVAHQAVGVLLFIKLATITWLAKAGFSSAVRGERLAHAGL